MKSAFLLLCGITLLSACNPDKKNDPTPSRTNLLTAKNWRVTAFTTTVTAGGSPVILDNYAASPLCQRDDFTKFNADRTMLDDEGASKCDPTAPQTATSSWAFGQGETQLLFGIPALPGKSIAFTIVELSATTLHLRAPSGTTGSEVVDITYTAF